MNSLLTDGKVEETHVRLIRNQDEVELFRQMIRDELDRGSTTFTIKLPVGKDDAEAMLRRSTDNDQGLVMVWPSVFGKPDKS